MSNIEDRPEQVTTKKRFSDSAPAYLEYYDDLLTAEERLPCNILDRYSSQAELFRRRLKSFQLMLEGKARGRLAAEEFRRKETGMGESLEEEVKRTLSVLDPTESLILRQRYGLDDGRCRTQVEIGRMIEYSPSRVGRIERQAKLKLKSLSVQNG